jgi:hypothetical protein
MKTRSNVLGCMLAVAVLPIVAGPAQASYIYDFDNYGLTAGTLTGQAAGPGANNWEKLHPIYGDATVETGPGVNATNVVTNTVAGGNGGQVAFTGNINYTSSDTAAVAKLWAYPGGVNPLNPIDQATGGLVWQGGANQFAYDMFGVTAGKMYYRNAAGTEVTGDSVFAHHWYDVALTMNFATGTASLSYRDVTSGSLTFTPDATISGVAMGRSGNATATGIKFYVNSFADTNYLDNISPSTISPVPEPGTLALVSTGVIALLAYAWRKRK